MSEFRIDVHGYLSTIPSTVFRPQDVVRELVTNAMQACDIAQKIEPAISPRIDVEMPDRSRFQITDNGVGFHPSILSKLGDLQVSKWDETSRILGVAASPPKVYGVFGMGLTSTMTTCREVLIVTAPIKNSGKTHYWWTDWEKEWFQWQEGERPDGVPANVFEEATRNRLAQHGARIILTLKDEIWMGPGRVDIARLEELVRYYFSAVSMPIHIGGSSKALNRGVTGWRKPNDRRSVREIVQSWLESRGLAPNDAPENEYHCFEIPLYDGISGVIWIRPFRADTVHFFARDVYGSDLPSLLPEYGRFVSAIVNDDKSLPDITKTRPQIATVEGVRREERIRSAIADALRDYVEWLNQEYQHGSQDTKEKIDDIGSSRYGRPLLAFLLSIATQEARRIAGNATGWIPVPLVTSSRKRTLPQCEEPDPDGPVVYYADEKTDLSRLTLLTKKYVVDARERIDWAILNMYRDAHEQRNLRIRAVADPADHLIHPIAEHEADELGFTHFLQVMSRVWNGRVTLARIDPQLGEAFAHVVRKPNCEELVLNKENQALAVIKNLDGDSLRAAVAHVVCLSRLLVEGRVVGEEFEKASENFTHLIVAVSETPRQHD